MLQVPGSRKKHRAKTTYLSIKDRILWRLSGGTAIPESFDAKRDLGKAECMPCSVSAGTTPKDAGIRLVSRFDHTREQGRMLCTVSTARECWYESTMPSLDRRRCSLDISDNRAGS